jgi:hypothetical protein
MDYSNMTRDELVAICKQNGIKGYSGKKKDYLMLLIKENNPVNMVIDTVSSIVSNFTNPLVAIGWMAWTALSENIEFKSTKKGVGHGENKVALELNTTVLGQNSDYDFIIDGVMYDAKQLDNNTFNTGVRGRDALRPLKNKLSDFINLCPKINSSPLLTKEEQALIKNIEILSPDEICVSNVKKITNVSKLLSAKQTEILSTLPTVEIELNGKLLKKPLYMYYEALLKLEEPLPSEYEDYTERLVFLNNISHDFVSDPTLFENSLNTLTSIFHGVKLIFVDKNKGYCIWDNMEYIKFERITKGAPRFRLCI